MMQPALRTFDMINDYLGWFCHGMRGGWLSIQTGRRCSCWCCCGGSTGGATHAQSAWPHANGHNSVNIRVILLIFVALDSPFKALQNNAIIWFWHGLDT